MNRQKGTWSNVLLVIIWMIMTFLLLFRGELIQNYRSFFLLYLIVGGNVILFFRLDRKREEDIPDEETENLW